MTMKLRVRDIVSHQGRDWVVEGLLSYKLAGKVYPLARLVDGDDVLYLEPLLDELDDRMLFLGEVRDLDTSTPPPSTIVYRGSSYLPRNSGSATVAVEGRVPGRAAGPCELWRYRAAGDLYLQVEKWPDRVVVLQGESVHKGMVDVLPWA
jgi:hypothetical protein